MTRAVTGRTRTVAGIVVLGILLAGCSSREDRSVVQGSIAVPAATTTATVLGSPTVMTGVASPLPAGAGSPEAGTPSAADAAQLGTIVWARAVDPTTNAPIEPVEAFTTDAPTIQAVVPVARIAAGTTVTATWTYNRTPILGVDSAVVASAETRDIWIAFHLTLAAGERWPDGTYAIVLSVNGMKVADGTVRVDEAP